MLIHKIIQHTNRADMPLQWIHAIHAKLQSVAVFAERQYAKTMPSKEIILATQQAACFRTAVLMDCDPFLATPVTRTNLDGRLHRCGVNGYHAL